MFIFKKTSDLNAFLKKKKSAYRDVGFVPTMGALHEGHLSLIHLSKANNNLSICSIFINPTQFNQSGDLEKYPRTTSRDITLLTKVGCDVLFLPDEKEIYPPGLNLEVNIELNGLETIMEGEFRPGHFSGVMQVVKRLLDIIQPANLYMGQKDFQQFSIIQQMINKLSLPVNLVMAPIIREENGLAKSSRNERLTTEQKEKASVIYQVLVEAKDQLATKAITQIEKEALASINIPGLKPEYFYIIDGKTLQPVLNKKDSSMIIACTAVWAGEVRLIDNYFLKGGLVGSKQ